MGLRGGAWSLAAAMLACAFSGAGRAVAAPPALKPGEIDDRWLSVVALDELRDAARTGRYAATAERLEQAMLERVSCGSFGKLAPLNDTVYADRACRYLLLGEKLPEGKKFAAWLLGNRGISRLMFRALGDVKSPEESLAKLQELVNADEKAVREYPDLAVAFATSQPQKHQREQPRPASMLDSFRWYTDPKLKFRCDLKVLPYDLLRYLADTRISIAERQWAMAAYGRSSDPAESYFHIDYDMDHLTKGKPKKIDAVPYSLDNLKRLGGVCHDEAYFASEVCKAVGVPACVVFGRGGSGVPHSWLACLRVKGVRLPDGGQGQEARWDAQVARYAEHHYFIGAVHEPAGGEELYDSVLRLYGEAAMLPLQQQEEADAAVALARLVEQASGADKPPDPTGTPALRKLAEAYDLNRSADPGSPKADTSWMSPAPKRPLGMPLAEDLMLLAIQRNLADPHAWDFLVELRKRDRLPVDRLDRFFEALMTRAVAKYPDFTYLMIMRTVPTIPEPAHRERVYKKVLDIFAKRPDLHGRILIAMADDYREQGKKELALQTYQQATVKCVHVAELVVKAAERAEEMFNDANRRDLAIDMYQHLFGKVQKDDMAGIFRNQTSHYQLGRRLADLLKAAGRPDAAKKVLSDIEG
jgi:tetratricopeptide (TPR) repeat protein